jgi:thiol-disulfide isomerase/thioredoxin
MTSERSAAQLPGKCEADPRVVLIEDRRRTEDRNVAGQRYRFERLTLPTVLRDLYFTRDDPGPGNRVPGFDLPTVAGDRVRSSDLPKSGPMLLIFGSSTCPVTDNAAPGLNDLYHRFGHRVRFVMVNVREAHPGKAIPQPGTLPIKLAHAELLQQLHNFEFEVAVDDIDGTLHRALSPKPNSAYLLGADGTILFRAQWASDTAALADALSAVVAGKSPRRPESGGVVRPTLRMLRNLAPVLDRAGDGAWADMWRVAPPLAAIALVLKALGVGSGRSPTIGRRPVRTDAA